MRLSSSSATPLHAVQAPSLRRAVDRSIGLRAAGWRCTCALARAGRLHAAELAPQPVEARGSSPTQKIHDTRRPRFIHRPARPAGIFPLTYTVYAMIRTFYFKQACVFLACFVCVALLEVVKGVKRMRAVGCFRRPRDVQRSPDPVRGNSSTMRGAAGFQPASP